MAQQTGITWETRFKTGFDRFQSETGKDVPDLMRELMRLFVEKLYHWTAPLTQGSGATGKKGGQRAVAQDVQSFSVGANQQWVQDLYDRFGPGPITAEYVTRSKKKIYFQNAEFEPSSTIAQTRLGTMHQSSRDNRGRVKRKNRGEGDFRDVIMVPYDAKEKYTKEVQKRVGKLKAGWEPALKATNSKLPPAWVSNAGQIFVASGSAAGFYDESALNPSKWSGYIEAENDVKYFRDGSGFMRRARDFIEKFVMKSRFDKWIEQMIDKHGAKS